MTNPKAILKSKEDRRLLRGHLWAYRNEFAKLPELEDGDIVDAVSDAGRFVGRGFFQAEGGIAVRLLADSDEQVDDALVARRIARARRYRETLYPNESVYRWVFGESDGLPGLVADRYGHVAAIETSCAFYVRQAERIANVFLADEQILGVRFQSGNQVQRFGEVPAGVDVTSFGVTFRVNLEKGQKTGLFLDQRENCMAAAPFMHGARVFDGYCYAGQWGLHAARAGASGVTCVDTSQPALDMARANAELNDAADKFIFVNSDVMSALQNGERYDVVIIDPPALAKARSQTQKALGHYQSLNRDAMQAVSPGGYLVTSSCSHFVDEADFLEMLKRAARAVQRPIWIVDVRGAARDHPVLMAMPETAYLKCATLRVF
ncbi:MAG: class I SAM-dependent rRNA methyltransferase [Candidatus Hydrogenedentes bacterium]|nr:class I SAM-dependent rRNA methyltransferase [Candidatus Hydrogenedentota bacterium]